MDDHTPLLDAIDQPVGLEEDLAKLGDAEVGKLARMAPALRKLGKVDPRLFDAFENIGRALAQIGRASGRARVCQYVWILVGAEAVKINKSLREKKQRIS